MVRREEDQKVLLGQDSTLDRPVWIVSRRPDVRPLAGAANPESPEPAAMDRRRRGTRGRWDAFTAPSGFPLDELVKTEGLPWRDVLPLLRELAEELRPAR